MNWTQLTQPMKSDSTASQAKSSYSANHGQPIPSNLPFYLDLPNSAGTNWWWIGICHANRWQIQCQSYVNQETGPALNLGTSPLQRNDRSVSTKDDFATSCPIQSNGNPRLICQSLSDPPIQCQSNANPFLIPQLVKGTSTIRDRPKCLNRGRFRQSNPVPICQSQINLPIQCQSWNNPPVHHQSFANHGPIDHRPISSSNADPAIHQSTNPGSITTQSANSLPIRYQSKTNSSIQRHSLTHSTQLSSSKNHYNWIGTNWHPLATHWHMRC